MLKNDIKAFLNSKEVIPVTYFYGQYKELHFFFQMA